MSGPPEDCLTEVREFERAKDFLEWLDVSDDRWSAGFDCRWVFRGQRNESWGLVPSAWRGSDEALRKIKAQLSRYNSSLMYRYMNTYDLGTAMDQEKTADCLVQGAAEIQLVSVFCRLADEIGLPVPDGPVGNGYDFLESVHRREPKVQYHPPFFPHVTAAYALAQHHGVPTRLLDFSYRSEVAAFFAADDAIQSGDSAGRMCVWAVNEARCVDGTDRKLQMMTVPRSTHSYLHAQDGLFIWAPEGDSDFLYLSGLIGARLDSVTNWRGWPAGGPVFRKATLPCKEAPEILRLLHLRRVTRSHLMPSYDSVAKTLHRKIELQ